MKTRMMKKFLLFLTVACLFSAPAFAVTNYSCAPVGGAAASATSHQWIDYIVNTTCVVHTSQPAVGDLANVAADTVLGNNTGSSAAPIATVAPVLGVAGTSTGSIGLSSSAGGTVTLSGGTSSITSYTITPPVAVPTTNGQAWTATTAGVGSWTTILAAKTTVVSKTTGYTVTVADDATTFDNSGAGGSVAFTLPTTSVASGDNTCYTVAAAQNVVVTANSGQYISNGVYTSAAAGNMTSNTVGSSLCVMYDSGYTNPTWVVKSQSGVWSTT